MSERGFYQLVILLLLLGLLGITALLLRNREAEKPPVNFNLMPKTQKP